MLEPFPRSVARRLAAGSLVTLAALASLAALDRGAASYLPVDSARRMFSHGGLAPASHARFGFAALPLAQAALDDYVARRRLAVLEADINALDAATRALEQQQAEDKVAFDAAAVAELARHTPPLAFPSSPPEIAVEPAVAPAAIATARTDSSGSAITGSIDTASLSALPDPSPASVDVPSAVPGPVPGQVPAVAAARITSTEAATLAAITPPSTTTGITVPRRARIEAADPTPLTAPAATRRPSASPAPAKKEASGWTRSIHDQWRN